MNKQKKEKLLDLFTASILNYQNAKTSVLWDYGAPLAEIEELQKECNEAIDEFKEVLYGKGK